MSKTVYLDSAASAPIFGQVSQRQIQNPSLLYANPSTQHQLGQDAALLLCEQREMAAHLLGTQARQVTFCSSATEANNLAIYNQLLPLLLKSQKNIARQDINAYYSSLDHPSSMQVLRQLNPYGLKLHAISLSSTGELRLGRSFDKLLTRGNEQFSVLLVNAVDSNTGRKQDIDSLALEIQDAQQKRQAQGLCPVYIHADLSQYLAAAAEQQEELGYWLNNAFDSIAISGQKIGAGRGAAILLQQRPSHWSLSQGGAQENGQRAGTENLQAICAIVVALQLQKQEYHSHLQRSEEFLQLLQKFPEIRLQPSYRVRHPELFSPFIFSIAAAPLPAEVAQRLLSQQGFMVGTGSACSSKAAKGQAEKLQSQGYEAELLPSILRVSFGNGASLPSLEELHSFLQCLQNLILQYS